MYHCPIERAVCRVLGGSLIGNDVGSLLGGVIMLCFGFRGMKTAVLFGR